jgi:hypothetical protein
MNAYPNRVLSNLLVALLALVFCAKPLATAAKAQSSPVGAPNPFHALPGNDGEPDSASNPETRGRDAHADSHVAYSDMKCSVVDWSVTPPKPPALVLVCPPEEVFAPLRVYFKLSWRRTADVPDNYQSIVAQSKALAKFHWTSQSEFHVLLKKERKKDGAAEPEWVNFNNLIGVYFKY